MESVQIDQRVVAPSRFESSSDDDEGKPVRISYSGDSNGADFPVISMRRGSRKPAPSAIPVIPVLGGNDSAAPPTMFLKALPGLQSPQAHGF